MGVDVGVTGRVKLWIWDYRHAHLYPHPHPRFVEGQYIFIQKQKNKQQ